MNETPLRSLLIERMVGDMSKVFIIKNLGKTAPELMHITLPKIEAAEAEIKGLFLNLIEQSKDQLGPLTWLEKEVKKL